MISNVPSESPPIDLFLWIANIQGVKPVVKAALLTFARYSNSEGYAVVDYSIFLKSTMIQPEKINCLLKYLFINNYMISCELRIGKIHALFNVEHVIESPFYQSLDITGRLRRPKWHRAQADGDVFAENDGNSSRKFAMHNQWVPANLELLNLLLVSKGLDVRRVPESAFKQSLENLRSFWSGRRMMVKTDRQWTEKLAQSVIYELQKSKSKLIHDGNVNAARMHSRSGMSAL